MRILSYLLGQIYTLVFNCTVPIQTYILSAFLVYTFETMVLSLNCILELRGEVLKKYSYVST